MPAPHQDYDAVIRNMRATFRGSTNAQRQGGGGGEGDSSSRNTPADLGRAVPVHSGATECERAVPVGDQTRKHLPSSSYAPTVSGNASSTSGQFDDAPHKNLADMIDRWRNSNQPSTSVSDSAMLENAGGDAVLAEKNKQHMVKVFEAMYHDVADCGETPPHYFLGTSGPLHSNHARKDPDGRTTYYHGFVNPDPETGGDGATYLSCMKSRVESYDDIGVFRRVPIFNVMIGMTPEEKVGNYKAALQVVLAHLGDLYSSVETKFLLEELDSFAARLPLSAAHPHELQDYANNSLLMNAIDNRLTHLAALLATLKPSPRKRATGQGDVDAEEAKGDDGAWASMNEAMRLRGDASRIMFRIMDAARMCALAELSENDASPFMNVVVTKVTGNAQDFLANNSIDVPPFVDLIDDLHMKRGFAPEFRHMRTDMPTIFHLGFDPEHLMRIFVQEFSPLDADRTVHPNGTRRKEMHAFLTVAGKAHLRQSGFFPRREVLGGLPGTDETYRYSADHIGADYNVVLDDNGKLALVGHHMARLSMAQMAPPSVSDEDAGGIGVALFVGDGAGPDSAEAAVVRTFLRKEISRGDATVLVPVDTMAQGKVVVKDVCPPTAKCVVLVDPNADVNNQQGSYTPCPTTPHNSSRVMYVDCMFASMTATDTAMSYPSTSIVFASGSFIYFLEVAVLKVMCCGASGKLVHVHESLFEAPKRREFSTFSDFKADYTKGNMSQAQERMVALLQVHPKATLADVLDRKDFVPVDDKVYIPGYRTFGNVFSKQGAKPHQVELFREEMARRYGPSEAVTTDVDKRKPERQESRRTTTPSRDMPVVTAPHPPTEAQEQYLEEGNGQRGKLTPVADEPGTYRDANGDVWKDSKLPSSHVSEALSDMEWVRREGWADMYFPKHVMVTSSGS